MKLHKSGFFKSIYRYIYYKLILPIKREKRPPEYIARGVAVGLFAAFTPIVWQMNIVIIIWVIARKLKLYFSLPIALALTWVTNAFTNIPIFYIYYITGQKLLGRPSVNGYSEFISYFDNGIWNGIKVVFMQFGLSILLGSIIFMVTFSILGYILAYRYAIKRNKKRLTTL